MSGHRPSIPIEEYCSYVDESVSIEVFYTSDRWARKDRLRCPHDSCSLKDRHEYGWEYSCPLFQSAPLQLRQE